MAKALVTGGAGFIGFHLASRLLHEGMEVVLADNFSRPGSESRRDELVERWGSARFSCHRIDVADFEPLLDLVRGSDRIYHLAGQVAVTESVIDPLLDFEWNARGTLNLLEAVRRSGEDPIILYSSTNKVYGSLESVEIREAPTRYLMPGFPHGIPETHPLDFHSPYGCSKGAGDQYMLDYHRIYGLRTVVFRQSCIYGPWQSPTEGQGWIAWFARAALHSSPITICGTGKQVRDVLYVEDLLEAFEAAVRHIEHSAGQAFNIGGGPRHSVSVWQEFRNNLEEAAGQLPPTVSTSARPGDQRVYVSDIRKAGRLLGWAPKVPLSQGLSKVVEWLRQTPAEWAR